MIGVLAGIMVEGGSCNWNKVWRGEEKGYKDLILRRKEV